VPAGDAFAVDRERFSAAVTRAISAVPNITLHREEVTSLDRGEHDFLVVATGPLTSDPLFHAIDDFLGRDGLYFYDAIAPIVAADSLDFSKLYWKSRYGKGSATDYLNAAMTRAVRSVHRRAAFGGAVRRTISRPRCISKAACRSRRSPAAASRRCASDR
jgi:methylenetetrahydrofolate--tRNA-(uracil-5-)-methyltransferase